MKIRSVWASIASLVLMVSGAAASTTLEREYNFSPDQFRLKPVNGATEVSLDGSLPSLDAGRPELPWISQMIDVPEGMQVSAVEAIEVSTQPLASSVRLPSAWGAKTGTGEPVRTTPDAWAFARPGTQPGQPVELGVQGFQRGRNVAALRICPVRWDASSGRLEGITHMRVRITLAPATSQPLERLRVVPEWEEAGARGPLRSTATLLSQGLGGRNSNGTLAATQIPSVLGSPVEYVIITNDDMAGEFQRLADWKTQSGVPAVVRTMSFIRSQYLRGSDDAERLRDFIRDAYSRWGAKWILLGGDSDVIPVRFARTTYFSGEDIATDLYYSCLDGNWDRDGDHQYGEGYINASTVGDSIDMLPEVYVGRSPTSSVADAKQFVDRTLAYEKTPVGDYEKDILIFAEVLFPEDWKLGDSVLLDGGSLGDELLPYITQNPSMRTARLYQNNTGAWSPPVYPETRKAVMDSISKGYGISVHIGHGYRNVMSLGDGNVFNSDVLGLNNGSRLTNLYAINCTSNAIDYPCIGESFLHAPNGGAVTSVGSTRLDFPYAGRLFEKEFFRLVFDDSLTAVGEAQAKQKIPQIASSGMDNAYRWMQHSLLLLGDPELRIWTGTPRTLSVSAPASFSLSDTSIAATITIGGQPLQNARVTAYKARDAFQSGLTNAVGFVRLPYRLDSLGTITLTVTGYDCRPYQTTLNVTAAAAAVLGDGTPTIDDDAVAGTSGDSDAIWDAGEVIDLRIPVHNSGGATATGVSATLSTTDPNVTLITPTTAYGTVSAGATVTPAGAFRLSLAATCPDQREIAFTLSITDAALNVRRRPVQITVRAPDLRHFAHDVSDNGNGNSQPDVGETVTYLPHLKNMGTAEAHTVTAVLRNYDGLATITDSTSTWGDVAAGQDKLGDGLTFLLNSLSAKIELRISDSHGLRLARLLDVVAAEVPGGLKGVGKPTSISLRWSPITEGDLLGYNIYRSLSAVGPFARANSVPTDRISAYEDGPLTALTRYYFQITSVDTSGNESARSTVGAFSTNPPSHTVFPIPMNASSFAPPAVDHLFGGYPLDIAAGSDVMYVWHPDGTAPIDADGAGATNGDFTTRGTDYEGGPSIADIDNNGQKEVIGVASDSTQVVVVQQSGALMPGWPQKISDGAWSSVAIGDLDNDGKKELVFGGFTGAHVFVFKSTGAELRDGDANPATNGVFKNTGTPYNIGTPAIADLDANGTRDIIYGTFDGKLNAWRPDGTNLPGFPITLPEPVTSSVAIGYLDGPGDTQLDIVVSTGYYPNSFPAKDSLYVFTATGARRAGFPKQLRGSDNNKAPSPALADMNNDGFLDIVAAGTDGKLYVYDRTGTALPVWAGGKAYSALLSVASEASPSVADIDGDGNNDVVMGDESGSLTALSGLDASIMPGFPIQLSSGIKAAPALCDCDGDGKTEIIVAGEDRNVSMWDYDFPFSPNGPAPWPQFHHDAARTGLYTNPVFVAVDPQPAPVLSAGIELAVPAPNPARGMTQLSYSIPSSAKGDHVELAIYDLAGRQVRSIESGAATPGRYRADWNLGDASGRRVEPGLYFARLSLGGQSRTQKLIVVQ